MQTSFRERLVNNMFRVTGNYGKTIKHYRKLDDKDAYNENAQPLYYYSEAEEGTNYENVKGYITMQVKNDYVIEVTEVRQTAQLAKGVWILTDFGLNTYDLVQVQVRGKTKTFVVLGSAENSALPDTLADVRLADISDFNVSVFIDDVLIES